MAIRKRNDSVKDGMGDSGTEGQDFTKKFNSYRGNYYQPGYPGGTKGGSEGCGHEPADERSQPGAYTDNDSGLRNVEDFQFTAENRQIWEDVEANQDEVSYGHNAITHGVNRKQGK